MKVISSTVQSSKARLIPTLENSAALQLVFDLLNKEPFAGQLENCVITITRRRRSLGYFKKDAFANTEARLAHEISVNPTHIALHGDGDTLGTLVHEMTHLWREQLGPLNRAGGKGSRGYHDVVWGSKMTELGLIPSSTGLPGGKKTGFRVSHYVVEGGRFDLLCRELLISGFRFPWADNVAPLADDAFTITDRQQRSEQAPTTTRARFVCSHCELKAYSKFTAKLLCGECHIPLIKS